MKLKYHPLFFLLVSCAFISCKGQTNQDMNTDLSEDFDQKSPFFYKMPIHLTANDTSPGWGLTKQKIMLTGTVYQVDGKTPAEDVILYYYQTNPNGVYEVKENEKRNMPKNKLGQTHGYIRGWVKTGKDGKYTINTTRPGTYPSRDEVAHIHLNVKEPDKGAPYYLDNFVFDDDAMLNTAKRNKLENRGGSGVMRFAKKGEFLIAERNIILGLNIPGYSKKENSKLNSGKEIGEDISSFTPFHAYGPDKDSKTCPICKYGWYHGILYFAGTGTDWTEVKIWLTFLEKESIKRKQYLKVYFIYGDTTHYNKSQRSSQLEQLGNELKLNHVALTFVPSFSDKVSKIYFNKINPDVGNTFLLYKRSNIIDKYINLDPTPENFEKIIKRLDQSVNEYFLLSKPTAN